MNSVLRRISLPVFFALLLLAGGTALAQHEPSGSQPATQSPGHVPAKSPVPAPAQQAPGLNEQFGAPLAQQSEAAAGHAAKEEHAEEKMVESLKHSASVQWLARMLHISTGAASWAGLLLNFGILAALIFWALKKNLPAVFYTRTQTIQRAIEEARKASEEANRRLADIEARLAKLDTEVSSMRSAAEQEAAAEEERIRAAAAEDTRRVVESAEGEIAAAAKLAQRELKAYAVDLAVTLAERRIQVDGATDQALVRRFVAELGDAKTPGANGSGKEKDGQ